MRRAARASRRDPSGRAGKTAPPAAALLAGRGGDRAVFAIALAYAALFSTLSAIKFRYYLYDDFDLAIFTQAVDGLLRGTMHGSIRGMNWLGDHSSLNLFLLAPLYAVFRHPVTLLVAQSVALAAGALPVHWTARRVLGDGPAGPVFAALYLLHPAVGYTNLYEFHPETLSTTALLFMLHFVHAGRLRAALVAAFLALLGKEDVALVVIATGLCALAPGRPRRGWWAASLVGLGAAFLALTFGVLKPQLAGAEAGYADMYADWGTTPRGVVLGLLRNPLAALGALFETPGDAVDSALKRAFHLQLLLPLGFLPLLAPFHLVPALPVLAEHLLSWRAPQHQIVWQYTALLTPSYVFAAIFGMRRLLAWLERAGAAHPRPLRAGALAGALAAALLANVAFGPVAGRGWLGAPRARQAIWPDAKDRALAGHRGELLRRLPARGAVVAGFEYQARLARRDSVHSLHHVLSGTYTFSRKTFPTPEGVSAALFDASSRFFSDSSATRLQKLLAVNGLRAADARGPVLLFVAGDSDTMELIAPAAGRSAGARSMILDHRLEFLGGGADSIATAGGVLDVHTHWRRVGPIDRGCLLQPVLFDAAGRARAEHPRYLGYMFRPPSSWLAMEPMVENSHLALDPDLPAGAYRLGLRMGWRDADGGVLDATADDGSPATLDLGWIDVRARRAESR